MTSYEEKKKKKSDKIREWLKYLDNNNEDDLLWIQKNRVYASSVPDLLYLMKKEKQDDIVDRQYEIVRSVVTYINELNREKVYSIVKQLKDLEDGKTINEFHRDYEQSVSQDNEKTTEIEQNQLKESHNKSNGEKFVTALEEYVKREQQEELYQIQEFVSLAEDFSIQLKSASILPMGHSDYYDNRIDIEIFSVKHYSIQIEEKEYRINFEVLGKIKEVIDKNLEKLIKYSLSQNKSSIFNNDFAEELKTRTILIKYGKLIISIDGRVVGEIGEFSKKIINEIKDIIIQANIIEITNENDTINLLVKRIKSLPNGTEFTISQFVDTNTDQLFSIAIDTFEKCEEEGIKIKAKYDKDAIVGLPQNLQYIKIDNE